MFLLMYAYTIMLIKGKSFNLGFMNVYILLKVSMIFNEFLDLKESNFFRETNIFFNLRNIFLYNKQFSK